MDNSTAASENLTHHRANHWKQDEDQKLIQLVQEHGPQHWNAIAQHMQGRTGKSCRLRWRNHLSPAVNRNPFTKEEEERLIAAREFYGTKWATIAKLFNGRTDNALKNHWHVLTARKRKAANNGSLQELVNASSSSSPCNTPHPHHDAFFHMRNFNAAQTAVAPVCPSASLSPVNFGSVPSFSESFPAAAAGTAAGMMNKGLFHSSSSAELKGSSSSEKNQAHDAGFKDATFYDFLGVGSDDDE